MQKFSHPITTRFAILICLLALNFFLFRTLIKQHQQLFRPTQQFLDKISPTVSRVMLQGLSPQSDSSSAITNSDLTPQTIVTVINQERTDRKLPELILSSDLSAAADLVFSQLKTVGGDFDKVDSDSIITTFLMQKKVSNLTLYHDTIIGPETTTGLFNYWNADQKHLDLVSNPDMTELGIATGQVLLEGKEQGVVVAIFGKPQVVRTEQLPRPNTVKTQKIVFPEISNQSILQALNLYRDDHKVHPLVEDARLCQYAEKRVKDLVKFGGLDEHEGFKKDFADPNNLPEPIKAYPGGAIGENLAYQYCKNMTTGDSFIAQTATSLIEWCFDSSTKGHREAQLNTRYNAVCARHQDGYFVIIFGE